MERKPQRISAGIRGRPEGDHQDVDYLCSDSESSDGRPALGKELENLLE